MGILDRLRLLAENRKNKHYDAGRAMDKHGYILERCVERGRFSTVYLARNNLIAAVRVAVKVVNEADCMYGEKSMWRRLLMHSNCVHLRHQFTDKGRIHFVYDYAENGDVMSWLQATGQSLGPHLENLFKNLTRDVLRAFGYIHGLQMAHLNFRWTNVVIDSNLNAQLTGFSYLCSKTDAEGICLGDPLYHPPEALTTGVKRHQMDKVDMWQLGAAILHLLMGYYIPILHNTIGEIATLANSMSEDVLIMDVVNQKVHLPRKLRSSGVSEELQSFLKELLQYRPEDRPKASQAINDIWLNR
ncbi:hypothetical protein CHUAL_012548 [Chamberlinius hualienensis]